ncbi:subtilisin-like protease SBT4.6 [Punica granatum]|uniref:Subtilisin-like protease SBT4.6 n=1 Tax=Punica granatum TaxID=22663 RepID=A0A6P8DMF7_PUNGR|nr:subtilisin-like protease SBT4.6 [Punica granatum]
MRGKYHYLPWNHFPRPGSASVSIVRSYKRSFNGFAAKLTKQEAEKLAKKDGVLSVFPSQTYHVQTTKSWDYIGLPNTVKRNPTVEGNTIIGVIDSGVYPNSESFSDKGFGPPPSKWKGSCNGGTNFTCNNKLIGARYYVSTEDTAVDASGHGTHTASTAAGNAVEGASFFGLANGTARGAVPSSRIAIYRVCDSQDSCEGAGILAAFDDAIADGVDIITVSLGGQFPTPFDVDSIAIGSFHAMSNGILVTHSAGNSGPDRQTVASVAPWVLTVAANTIDRKFISKLELNDGTVLTGIAVNSFPSSLSNSALVFGDQVAKSCDEGSARLCFARCLDMQKVSGKILVCQSGDSSVATVAAIFNASGVILMQDFPDTAFVFPLPAVALDNTAFEKLMSYYNSTRNPQGRILKGETVPDSAAPVTASFSSRGPNAITPDIMKPDVSAPGVDILAAYPPDVPPSKGGGDDRRVKFNVISGTSMSCPHVAGAAAYVKTFHPDWSPSAIKSALMTTASKIRDITTEGDPSRFEFSYGSGQINPIKAADPGLVYEITKDDYVNLLCSLGINIRRIDGNSTCPKGAKNITEAELNYPSLIFKAPVSKPFKLALSRTVTNVGPPNSTYKAKAISASNVNITVVPEILSFKSIHEKKSFTVEISGSGFKSGTLLSEEVLWSDGIHSVRSPIIVLPN